MMMSVSYCLIRISEHCGCSGTSGQLGQRGIRGMSVKVLSEWQFRILTQNYEMAKCISSMLCHFQVMYSWNLWQHLYFDGLVGGCRDGAGVREGSDRARPSSENMLNIYIMIIS